MSSVTTSHSESRDGARIAVAARSVVAGLLAVATTFNADHTAAWGLLVFGVFQLAQAVVIAFGSGSLARTSAGRGLAIARAVLGAGCGAAALLLGAAGLWMLVLLGSIAFLSLGVLELLSGLRKSDATRFSGDLRVVGVLSIIVGVLYSAIPATDLWVVGVLGAWGAVVAVYLGIAAASPRMNAGGR